MNNPKNDSTKGKNKYRINADGTITVHNYLAAELPTVVNTLKSGRTTYRFIGSYDGYRSLPSKLLTHMVNDSEALHDKDDKFPDE